MKASRRYSASWRRKSVCSVETLEDHYIKEPDCIYRDLKENTKGDTTSKTPSLAYFPPLFILPCNQSFSHRFTKTSATSYLIYPCYFQIVVIIFLFIYLLFLVTMMMREQGKTLSVRKFYRTPPIEPVTSGYQVFREILNENFEFCRYKDKIYLIFELKFEFTLHIDENQKKSDFFAWFEILSNPR